MPENRLIHASSPYLLQHAHNPVDWYPWGNEALQKAVNEHKPILVSIGYSACHWCHVMERESFENENIAAIMNRHFVCIKVDREERPDVDQVYMEALHAMGLQGGWPLNVFLLPNQKPFYGGTYFPPEGWTNLLQQINQAFHEQYEELAKSAEGFGDSLSQSEIKRFGLRPTASDYTSLELTNQLDKLAELFDTEKGGMNRAPKFPMPVIYSYLFRVYHATGDERALQQATLTLDQMAFGGLYDQIGGGFTRYSTDSDWFVPHFEKMLYDNGQLLSLYSEGYQVTKKVLYKEIVYQTVDWLEREMLNDAGGFYSALDADSEGEEGKFYLWNTAEVKALLGNKADLIIDYYNLTQQGNWEPGKNIPFRSGEDEAFAASNDMSLEALRHEVTAANEKLLTARASRVRPGLDDKILSGWNGLLCKGLVQAYAVFNEPRFLDLAIRNMEFLLNKMAEGYSLYRTYKAGKASITAYLEDYAAVIDALIELYQVTFDETWLKQAEGLTDYTLTNFFDDKEQFFYYTDATGEKLISRKKELFDNVIPSSNSIMASNLYRLGLMLGKQEYTKLATSMLDHMKDIIKAAPRDLANWGKIYTQMVKPTAEIAIVAEDLNAARNALDQHYLPNKVVVGKNPNEASELPLLESREMLNNQPTFYLCYNQACQLPVNSVSEVLNQLQS